MSISNNAKVRLVNFGVFVAVIALAVGGYIAIHSKGGHTITAQFTDASFLVPGNDVHIDGVSAGSITSLKVKDNVAYVKMHLASGYWPIHDDATAQVRPVSLLGEEYVDIEPGSASAPVLRNGGMIPDSHTSTSVNLQSILDSVNDPTSTALAVLVSSLGEGVGGQGANEADIIKALSPALTDTSKLVDLLDSQNQLLTTMIDNVQPVLSSLDTDKGASLNKVVSSAKSLLSATASKQTALASDVQGLPATLDSATNAFTQLRGLANEATPALASVSPLTDNLTSISDELESFSQAANPAVTELKPVLADAKTLVDRAGPVVSSLEAEAPEGLSDVTSLKPIVEKNVADLNGLFNFLRGWALATEDYDNVSHYFRFFVNIDPSLAVPVASSTKASSAKTSTTTAKASTPAASSTSTANQPASATNPLSGLSSLLSGVGGLLGGKTSTKATSSPTSTKSPSATGLSSSQEKNLLNYLLGGL